MPIKGLSEVRRLPRLGKIRMGIKVPNASGIGEHPQKTDYFVLKDKETEPIRKVYGEKPTCLDIVFPVEDEEKIKPQYYKNYSLTQGLRCHGTGAPSEENRRLIDTDTGEMVNRDTKHSKWVPYECMGKECPEYQAKQCKGIMSLQFILYKVPGFGVWQINSGSWNSIVNINSCIDYIRALFGGHIAMIPLQLTIEPKEVQDPDSGKRLTVYVLNLRNNMTLAEMKASTIQFQKQLGIAERLTLPPAAEEVEPDEIIEDGNEPESPEPPVQIVPPVSTPPATPAATQQPKETTIEWDDLKAARPPEPKNKLDIPWAISTISTLQKKGVEAVRGLNLKDRFEKQYHIQITPEKKVKEALEELTQEQAVNFATWLQDLEKMAG
jgi:hypothetical protein